MGVVAVRVVRFAIVRGVAVICIGPVIVAAAARGEQRDRE